MVRVLSNRWGWLIIGFFVIAGGSYVFATAHTVNLTETHGTITRYTVYTRDTTYDHSELQISESTSIYLLNQHQFQPPLPQQFYYKGAVNFWVDQGTTTIIAIILYDDTNRNPVKYTTDHYNQPTLQAHTRQRTGVIIGSIGVLFLLLSLVWPLLANIRHKPDRAVAVPVTIPAGEQHIE